MDLTKKTNSEIDIWIANHERKKETGSELYKDLIAERSLRHGRGLSIDVSIEAMKKAAREQRYISYGELAEANGINWSKARHLMNGKHGHLDSLLAHCHSHSLPLFTAIVVQKGKLGTGLMDDFTLAGFIEGVERLGRVVIDARKYLSECQEQCFSWGKVH